MLALSICRVHSMNFFYGRVEKNFEGFGYVNWHENVDILFVEITFNGQSTVVLTF